MRRGVAAVVLLLSALVTASCSVQVGSALCSGRVSVADYVVQFNQGLANFGDDETLTLEADSLSALDVSLDARNAGGETGDAARSLAESIAEFVKVMNSWDWIISDALDDPRAVDSADALGTSDVLRRANTVEAYVIQRCGSVSTLAAPQETPETLPAPVVPAPDATDPESSAVNDQSGEYALGSTVGSMFGLTLTPVQVQCLGTQLQGVVDVTSAQAGPDQYQGQFQSAFDKCGIGYKVGQS